MKQWIGYHELIEKGMTPREAEIVHMYNHGDRETEIMEKLFITRKTVNYHIKNILKKLGTRDKRMILFDGGEK